VTHSAGRRINKVEKLGRWLSGAREAKGSTLEEAEAATRIRAQFLELLEAGDFASFPGGDVQVRGFLRIYARYLDLSSEEAVRRYRAEVQGREPSIIEAPTAKTPSQPTDSVDDLTEIRFHPRDIPVTSSLPRWMSVETVLIFGVVLIVLLIILAIVSYIMNRPGAGQALASVVTMVPSEVAFSPTSSPSSVSPTPALLVGTDGEVTLKLGATEHVRARVKRGVQVVFDGLMAPGQIETWSDDEIIVVATGNGAGLQVTVNGEALGPMCGRGEVCTRAWGPTGEIPPP
jgi:cytoskeletal protein RodZ